VSQYKIRGVLQKLSFKFGSSEGESPLEFEPGPMTVFVGPNNSGKSLVLREIENVVGYYNPYDERTDSEGDSAILERLEPRLPSSEEVEWLLQSRAIGQDPDIDPYVGSVIPGYVRIGKHDFTVDPDSGRPGLDTRDIDLESTLSDIATAKSSPEELRDSAKLKSSTFGAFIWLFTIRLDGRTRFALTEPRPAGSLQKQAHNHLWSLLQDDDARERLREITFDAFERYFLIDPTAMRTLRIKMSKESPPEGVEHSLTQTPQEFFGRATDITDLSDGVRAFTGLTATVSSGDYRIMLVDEPEAFLHPHSS
jgi:hypothetical protein